MSLLKNRPNCIPVQVLQIGVIVTLHLIFKELPNRPMGEN
jgi:hypothetical protein